MTPFLAHQDEAYVRQAIALAMRGRGSVEPNPMVGCLLVKGGRIIGSGFHRKFGQLHAERDALANCTDDPRGATAYVTLEPCCHLDKKQPPCVPALIEAGIARVVAGCRDPNPAVDGKGFDQLRQAGIEVDAPVAEGEARQLIAPFIARTNYARPYVTMKWAQTADGYVAGPGGKRLHISNDASHRVLHALRARCDAILVGIGTVLADDPLLTARNVTATRPLIRVVCDSDLRIPVTSQLAQTVAHGPVVIYCKQSSFDQHYALATALAANGATIVPVPANTADGLSLPDVLRDLGGRGVMHLLVEAGPTIGQSFMKANLVDRVWIFRSTIRVEDASAPLAPAVDYQPTGSILIGDDALTEYLNRASEVFYHRSPSADLMLAGAEGL